MATIDYSKRTAKLGNLGETRKAMAPVVPDTMAGVDRTHAWERAYARQGQAWGEIADGAAKLGKAMISLDAFLQGRENERMVDKAAGMVMSINDQNLMNPEKDDNGRAVGLLNRAGEDCLNLPQEGHESLTKTLNAVAEELELTDAQVGFLKERLSPYAMSCMGRLRARQRSEMGRIQLADAEALWKRDVQTIADGNNSDAMYEAALKDYDHYMDLAGVSGDARDFQRQTFVRTLFAADVKRTVAGLTSEEEFDAAIKAAEERPESLFMGNEVLKREMGGEVGEDLHRTLLKEMRAERTRFRWRTEQDRREELKSIKDGIHSRELEMIDKGAPESAWVDFYEEVGQDENLRRVDPGAATGYHDAALRLRKSLVSQAETADRARVSANGDILVRSFVTGVPDPTVAGGRRMLTVAEKHNLAEFLYANGEIGFSDYTKAKKQISQEASPLAEKFFSMVTEKMDRKFPQVCRWQEDLMSYGWRDTQEAREFARKKTPFSNTYLNESNESVEERMLFNQYVDAANIAVSRMLSSGPKPGEDESQMLLRAKEDFDRMTQGTQEGIYRLSIDRRNDLNRRNAEALMNTNRNRLSVELPAGIEVKQGVDE